MCLPNQGPAGPAIEFMDGIPIQVDKVIQTFQISCAACHEVARAP
jgi:hypothetical protein